MPTHFFGKNLEKSFSSIIFPLYFLLYKPILCLVLFILKFLILQVFFFSILGLYLKEGKENPTPQITPAKDIFEGQAMRGRNSGRNWKKAVPGQVGTHLSI